jgi:hypothetical protein
MEAGWEIVMGLSLPSLLIAFSATSRTLELE